MKIPKTFIYFLVVAQIILLLGHYALYSSLVFFFPILAAHSAAILVLLIFLSVSFLVFSFLDYKSKNFFIRWGYVVSATWMPLWFYLLLASVLALILYTFVPAAKFGIANFIFAFAVLLLAYGIINARVIRTVSVRIKLPNLPEKWKGKTAVLVTDLHLGHILGEGFANKVIAHINNLQPDIVFIAGDFFDSVPVDFGYLAGLFKSITSHYGTYYVSGNHEFYIGYKECEDAIAAAGIHILENQKVELDGLQIAGTAYKEPETIDGLREILCSLDIDRSRPSVLLKHVPNVIGVQAVHEAGVSLQLSGHTHQGQLWPGRFFTNKIFQGFDYGLKRMGNLQVFTSSGVGSWGPPVRAFTRSEIIKIIFE